MKWILSTIILISVFGIFYNSKSSKVATELKKSFIHTTKIETVTKEKRETTIKNYGNKLNHF